MLVVVFSCLAAVPAVSPAHLNLGAEESVSAGASAIDVPGYSVPSFAHWDDDGLQDLIVGEGSGTDTGRVRIYLNEGTQAEPAFSTFSYAQSDGADLALLGGG